MPNSRIKKIIFILSYQFCKRDYDRFGIELLKANGFEVLVWDLTPIINPDFYNNAIVSDPVEYNGYTTFFQLSTIIDNILNLGNDCFIIMFGNYCSKFYKILRSMSRKNIPYCFEASGASFPVPEDFIRVFSKRNKLRILLSIIIIKIKKFNFKSLKDHIFRRIPYKLLLLNPPDFVITGGAKSNIHLYRLPLGPKTKMLPIHYYDYDNYLAEMGKSTIIDQTTGVFLDQDQIFNLDNLLSGSLPPMKAEEYYPYLRQFFDYLEGNFKVKIIIAAHPRSHYESNSDYFGGRPVIRNRTCELVKAAGFAIAHHSYSINYAVLFNKPILLLTSDKFEKCLDRPYITAMATVLGIKPIFMDKPYTLDWEKELIVDMAKYHEYKQNHIKMDGTEELPFWQVVANYIKANY